MVYWTGSRRSRRKGEGYGTQVSRFARPRPCQSELSLSISLFHKVYSAPLENKAAACIYKYNPFFTRGSRILLFDLLLDDYSILSVIFFSSKIYEGRSGVLYAQMSSMSLERRACPAASKEVTSLWNHLEMRSLFFRSCLQGNEDGFSLSLF